MVSLIIPEHSLQIAVWLRSGVSQALSIVSLLPRERSLRLGTDLGVWASQVEFSGNSFVNRWSFVLTLVSWVRLPIMSSFIELFGTPATEPH